MIYATRPSRRSVWFAGFGLLAIVGVKLMMIDLANKGTVMWTASLIGIALLVIAASYFSPAPPKHSEVAAGSMIGAASNFAECNKDFILNNI